uniref:carbohydrate porin n=1 Tax=Ningiella ruwaisensis TaxID=2364274 RepID=UPI0019D5C677|nr:carbohydrate porin [Ningiella ruwaisensis]
MFNTITRTKRNAEKHALLAALFEKTSKGLLLYLSCIGVIHAQSLNAQYDIDLLKNTSGGKARATEYVDLLSLSVDDNFTFSEDTSISYYASAIYSNGHSFSQDIVGDDHIVSNLEGGARFTKLAEVWIDLQYKNSALLFGLYDINAEFDVLESANLFINSGHGIGNDIGLTGANGPSIYPFYSLALRYKYQINAHHQFLIAMMDGFPGDPESPNAVDIDLDLEQGVFTIAEWQYTIDNVRWLFGAWQYSKSQVIDQSERADRKSGNFGLYLRHERLLISPDTLNALNSLKVHGFFRLGLSDDKFNKYDSFASAGLVFSNFSAQRPNDSFGLAFAYTGLGDRFTNMEGLLDNEGLPAQFANGELNLELSYQAPVNKYITLQPMLQYVVEPSGFEQENALITGLRLSLSF